MNAVCWNGRNEVAVLDPRTSNGHSRHHGNGHNGHHRGNGRERHV